MSDSRCTVTPFTVLMAIRYGLGRSLTHADALALIRDHWDAVAPHRKSLLADVQWVAECGQWSDVRDSARVMADWIKAQPMTTRREVTL